MSAVGHAKKKCYWAGCEGRGEYEWKGGLLCRDHFLRIYKVPVPQGDVIGRTPEPYLGELDRQDWDLTRDLKIRDGYKLLKTY